MAKVVQDPQLQERIERFLKYALDEWSSVPEYAAEFDSWDWLDQIVFVHEWDIRESAVAELTRYAQEGLLTPDQWTRYEELQSLVARHRPRIEALRRE